MKTVVTLCGKPLVVGEPITEELLDAVRRLLTQIERERASSDASFRCFVSLAARQTRMRLEEGT